MEVKEVAVRKRKSAAGLAHINRCRGSKRFGAGAAPSATAVSLDAAAQNKKETLCDVSAAAQRHTSEQVVMNKLSE